jgi:uncharacterized surface protein with fasciclin (FAS1) repeats
MRNVMRNGMNKWRVPLGFVLLVMVLAACSGGTASDTTVATAETMAEVADTEPSTDDTEPRTDDTSTDDTEPRTDDTSTDDTEARTDETTAGTGLEGGETIVDAAAADGRFATLLSAIEAAGLTEELAGAGPYTLFAPTDDAFADLPQGTLEELLADPSQLEPFLLYHVVPGEYLSDDLSAETALITAQGSDLPVSVDGETVMVGDATIVEADITAGNGVIHVIDRVLSPPARLG